MTAEELARALGDVVGGDASVWVWGPNPDEPVGDIYLYMPEFAQLVLDRVEANRAKAAP